MSFWGVSRRGFRMWEVTTIPRAFTTEMPSRRRKGRYAPDMRLSICEIVHEGRRTPQSYRTRPGGSTGSGPHFSDVFGRLHDVPNRFYVWPVLTAAGRFPDLARSPARPFRSVIDADQERQVDPPHVR